MCVREGIGCNWLLSVLMHARVWFFKKRERENMKEMALFFSDSLENSLIFLPTEYILLAPFLFLHVRNKVPKLFSVTYVSVYFTFVIYVYGSFSWAAGRNKAVSHGKCQDHIFIAFSPYFYYHLYLKKKHLAWEERVLRKVPKTSKLKVRRTFAEK